jgi:Domain of unknown function (DUF5615)
VPVPFHLDEQIPPALAEALRSRGIDVTTAADADLLGCADREHLAFAKMLPEESSLPKTWISCGCIRKVYRTPASHYGDQQSRTIGEVLRRPLLIHAVMSPDEMKNRVEYL